MRQVEVHETLELSHLERNSRGQMLFPMRALSLERRSSPDVRPVGPYSRAVEGRSSYISDNPLSSIPSSAPVLGPSNEAKVRDLRGPGDVFNTEVLVSSLSKLAHVKTLRDNVPTSRSRWALRSFVTASKLLLLNRNQVTAGWRKSAVESEERTLGLERRNNGLKAR